MGDKKNRRSSYATERSGGKRGRKVHSPSAGRGYKAALDRLFDKGEVSDQLKGVVAGLDSGGVGEGRQQLIRMARGAETQKEFNDVLGKLFVAHRLPDDEDILVRALDHPNEDLVEMALDNLLELDGRRPLGKRQIIKMKLQTLENVSGHSGVLDMVEMLKARL